jgi:hypothetical protein
MSDNRHETERIYDEEMSPLIDRLLRIAADNNIPLFLDVGMIIGGIPGASTSRIQGDAPRMELLGRLQRHELCRTIAMGDSRFDRAHGLAMIQLPPPAGRPAGEA